MSYAEQMLAKGMSIPEIIQHVWGADAAATTFPKEAVLFIAIVADQNRREVREAKEKVSELIEANNTLVKDMTVLLEDYNTLKRIHGLSTKGAYGDKKQAPTVSGALDAGAAGEVINPGLDVPDVKGGSGGSRGKK